jgi:hypothetical protein
MFRRLPLAVPLVALALGAAQAPDPPEEMGAQWAKKWAEATKDFSAKRDRARAAALSNFDKALEKVDRQRGLTPAARTDRRRQLQEARDTFEKKGTFPPDDEFVVIELDYFMKVNKAAIPVSQLIDQVIEKGSKTKNDDLEKQGLKLKTDLEQHLGGASRLVPGSAWRGELRWSGGNTVPYHLTISKVSEGGLFKGHVEDNPGVAGNWNYDVEGQTRALGVQYKLSKNLRGNAAAVVVDGIVSGDRLIGNMVQVSGNRRSTGVVVLKCAK